MTVSERRLHPASILFDVARYARFFVWPALVAYFGGSRAADPWLERYSYGPSETWLWILMVPSLLMSIARFLTFRVRYEPDALVIRSGILFRNLRHVPYARIQNLDAVQNVFHRALGVVEIRVETGGGGETEARLSVLPRTALDEMRARVRAGRERADVAAAEVATPGAPAAEPVDARTHQAFDAADEQSLLHLPLRELLLCGLLENKGIVVVGAAYGALWEAGAMNWIWRQFFSGNVDARGVFREILAALFGSAPLPMGRLLLALGGLVAFLVLVRLVSMAWAFVRLYDFRLVRHGDDLRLTFGLFTRVTATIPRRRIQTLTIEQGWLHRSLGRASIRVETAGGAAGAAARDREWVAPLVRVDGVARLVAELLPGAGLEDPAWQPVHPRAFRRALKPAFVVAALISSIAVVALGWRAAWLAAVTFGWSALSTRQRVRHLHWLATDDVVAFRSGWLGRRDTRVRANRIQVVTTLQSPLDRRAAMARVRVDTAGAGELSHRIDIPYLAVEVADALRQRLAGLAARTAFRW